MAEEEVRQREQVITAVGRLRDEGVPESQISDAAELWLLVSSAKNELTAVSLGQFYARLGASFPVEELERMIAALAGGDGGGGAGGGGDGGGGGVAAMDFYTFVRAVGGCGGERADAFARSLQYLRGAGGFASAPALRGVFAEMGEALTLGEAESMLQTADEVGLAAGGD